MPVILERDWIIADYLISNSGLLEITGDNQRGVSLKIDGGLSNTNETHLDDQETKELLNALIKKDKIKTYNLSRILPDQTIEFLTLFPRLTQSGTEYDFFIQSAKGTELRIASYRLGTNLDVFINAIKEVI